MRQPGERLRLEPLDVELDEGWHAVLADQFVERRNVDRKRLRPGLRLPSLGAAAGFDEVPRQRGRRGIVEIDHHRCGARHPPDRGRYQGDAVVASEQDRERSKQGRLRLHGNDLGAKPAKRANSVTDVRADIEDEIVRLDESRIERIHRVSASGMPVIGAQRSKDTPRGSKASQHGLVRRDGLGDPQSRKPEMLQRCRGIRFLGQATDADARQSQAQRWARGEDTEWDRQRQTTGPQDRDVGQRRRLLQAKRLSGMPCRASFAARGTAMPLTTRLNGRCGLVRSSRWPDQREARPGRACAPST